MIHIFCIISFILLIIGYSLIENRYIKTVRYTLHFDKKHLIQVSSRSDRIEMTDGSVTRIVQLSDLHNCRYGKKNEQLVKKIKACRPDLILVTGDMINKYQSVDEAVFDLFQQLSDLCPCVYSLGNHELKQRNRYPKRFQDYIRRLQSYGIIVSDNEKHEITLNNTLFRLASFSSDLHQYRKLFRRKNSDMRTTEIPVADTDGITILLSHDPELTEQYVKTGYSLVFSGHLHGGIIRIPGWRGIVSTRFAPFPKYDGGCYRLDESHVLIVSRGLGSHTIKFRLFNRPELVQAVIVSE